MCTPQPTTTTEAASGADGGYYLNGLGEFASRNDSTPLLQADIVKFAIDITILIFTILLIAITFPIWIKNKRRYLRLKKRSTMLTISYIVGMILWLLATVLKDVVGNSTFRCDMYLLFFILHLPFLLFPLMLKIISFRNKLIFSRIKANLAIEKQVQMNNPSQSYPTSPINSSSSALVSSNEFSTDSKFDLSDETSDCFYDMIEFFIHYSRVVTDCCTYCCSSKEAARPKRVRSIMMAATNPSYNINKDKQAITHNDIATARFSRSWGFVVLFTLISLLPFFLLIGLKFGFTPYLTYGCTACKLESPELIVLIVVTAVAGFPTLILTRKTDIEMDPLKNTSEVHISLLFLVPCLFTSYILTLVDPSGYMSVHHTVNWLWIGFPGILIAYIIQVPYQIYKAKEMTHHGKQRTGSITEASAENGPDIEEVLSSEKLTEAFQNHLVAEFCVENLIFLLQVRLWRSSYDTVSENQRLNKAIEIYRTFVPVDSALEINIPENVRKPLETIFKSGKVDEITKNVFNSAVNEVKALLVTDSLPRFYRSDLFLKAKEKKQPRTMGTVVTAIKSAADSLRDSRRLSRTASSLSHQSSQHQQHLSVGVSRNNSFEKLDNSKVMLGNVSGNLSMRSMNIPTNL